MKSSKRKKLTKKQKKELYIVLGFLGTIMLTLLEFGFYDFSPWIQIRNSTTIPSILTISLVVFLFFRKKIFRNETKPTNLDYLRETISILAISATLTIPIWGLISLTNRSIGRQVDYELNGNILSLDSISVYNKSSHTRTPEYSVEIVEANSETTFKFKIWGKEYKELKGKSEFKRKMKKGFWGYLYEK
uniref:hypothetical protein n=1 Tax=uncultured Draconibacterium sp. TaxID=1573823 RepID=UPI003217FBB3